MVDVAEIKIWGEAVGAVRWDPDRQLATFQYDKKFLARGYDLSPIRMPVSQGDRIYSFPELRKAKDEQVSTFKGMPGLLADALPDKYGNQLINAWLASQGRPPDSINPVELLCFIGSRGMGAMEFEPAQYRVDKQTFAVEIDSLVDIARRIVVDRADVKVQLDHDEQQAMLDILKIGTSAGGARPKAVIAYNPRTKEIRSGQTIAPKGFEHWLLKLDGVSGEQFGASHGYGRIEYAYHLMSTDCGIAMMDCQLLEENGRAHFMTRRFDREGHDIRHHVQTLCGIQHYDYTHLYSYSYEQLFQTMRMLRMTYPEAEQMFRRVVFNVMATNNDDHTKNFAFLLRQGGRWELAPAYDICYAYDPTNIWVSQHALSIQGKHKDINRTDLMALARQNSIRKGEDIIEEIRDIVSQWPHYAAKANVSAALTEMIDGSLGAYRFK